MGEGRITKCYKCRGGGALCKVEYNNGTVAWEPYEYCVGAHNANGPTVSREVYDEHGERVDDHPTVDILGSVLGGCASADVMQVRL